MGIFSQTTDEQFNQAQHEGGNYLYFNEGYRYWLRFDEMYNKTNRSGIMMVFLSFTVLASDDPAIPVGAEASQSIKLTWDSWLSNFKRFIWAACQIIADDEEQAESMLAAVWSKPKLDALIEARGDDLRGLEPIELTTAGTDTQRGGRYTQHYYSPINEKLGEPVRNPDRLTDVGNQAKASGGSGSMFGRTEDSGGGAPNAGPSSGGSGGMFGRK